MLIGYDWVMLIKHRVFWMSKSVMMFSFKLVVPGSPCSMLPQICKKMWRRDNDFDVVNVSPVRIFFSKIPFGHLRNQFRKSKNCCFLNKEHVHCYGCLMEVTHSHDKFIKPLCLGTLPLIFVGLSQRQKFVKLPSNRPLKSQVVLAAVKQNGLAIRNLAGNWWKWHLLMQILLGLAQSRRLIWLVRVTSIKVLDVWAFPLGQLISTTTAATTTYSFSSFLLLLLLLLLLQSDGSGVHFHVVSYIIIRCCFQNLEIRCWDAQPPHPNFEKHRIGGPRWPAGWGWHHFSCRDAKWLG